MRKLAHIEQIAWLRPIEGADKIELAGILGWQCIVKKNEFKVGDLAIYVEIDSIMPADNPDFAFLESKHYKIKTMKMRGVISQGIIFPLSILHDGKAYVLGDDVTDVLKIKQVEDEVPKQQVKDPAAAIKQRHKKLFKNQVFLWFMKFKWFRKTVYKLLAPKKKPKNFPEWIVKMDSSIATDVMHDFGIKWVPILNADFKLLPTVDEMIAYADGKSTLCDTLREGVVIRDHDNTISFKCISNQFLLKHNL